MKKSLSDEKTKKVKKNFSFFTRITTLLIIAAAIIIGAIFSFFYLDNNSNLSIEFGGGYKTQIKYDGVYEDDSKTQNVVNLLENRVDPLGTSNINIEKSTSIGSYYNISISKNSGIDIATFLNNISRRGYVYLLDDEGHDLLANSYNSENKSWTGREKRILAADAFSHIYSDANPNSHQPEVILSVNESTELIKTIQSLLQDSKQIYFYADIGGLLNYVRNTLTGLQELVKFIDTVDVSKQLALKALLANDTLGIGDDSADILYNAVKNPNSNEGKELINLLNQAKNGIYMIKWKYSDALNTNYPLSVDTNNEENVFDPENPFNPGENKGSPMNAWLPHIKDLMILPDISRFLDTAVINYQYAPYYIGAINNPSNLDKNNIKINDDTFSKEKVQQIVNILNAGLEKNNVTVLSFLNVDPTLGATALKIAIIGLLVSLGVLSLAIIVNYRFLGVIAVLIIILFLVATLVTFTFLNNVVAPETGIALILGLALLLDLIIGLFNSLQKEYQSGKTVFDAFKVANKKSLVSAFDCSLIVLIVSLTIFWFGTRSIRGFAIMTSISTFGVIVLGILLLRFVLYLLLKNNTFENKPHLLALNHSEKTKSNAKFTNMNNKIFKSLKINQDSNFWHISKWNFWHKTTKWLIAGFGVILLLSGVVYLATGSNFGQGFDSRIDFTGEAAVTKYPNDPDFDLWQEAEIKKNEVIEILDSNHKSYQKIYAALNIDSLGQTQNAIKIIIETNISFADANDLNLFLNQQASKLSWSYTTNNALSGNQLFKNMLLTIAIALITILIYVIVRFQITFALPLIGALVFAFLLTLSLLALLQITITSMIIGVILAVIIMVLINSVVIFDKIKEIKLNNHEKRNKFTKDEIIALSNEGIKKSLLRTLTLNIIIILTALIVLCFIPSFWSVSLALIIASIATFIASHFIGPWLWTFFERWRIKRYEARLKKIKKHFVGPDEYIIEGIND